MRAAFDAMWKQSDIATIFKSDRSILLSAHLHTSKTRLTSWGINTTSAQSNVKRLLRSGTFFFCNLITFFLFQQYICFATPALSIPFLRKRQRFIYLTRHLFPDICRVFAEISAECDAEASMFGTDYGRHGSLVAGTYLRS